MDSERSVSFEIDGTREDVDHVLRSTKIFALAESLGGVESLIEHPASMSHASMNPELREKAGINEQVIRLSVGIEHPDDLIEDQIVLWRLMTKLWFSTMHLCQPMPGRYLADR